jgi:hypothetical protein
MNQMKPYCFKCGAELDPDTIYCPVCGRLQRSMVVRNVGAGGAAGAQAQGGIRRQEATSAQGYPSQVTGHGYRPQAEQAYEPATEEGYGEGVHEQHYYQSHYEPHDQHYAQANEQPYPQVEQGQEYLDDQPPEAEGEHAHYGAVGQHSYQPTYDAYEQGPDPGYDLDSYASRPESYPYDQEYAPEQSGDHQQPYASSPSAAEAQEHPEAGYAPQIPEEPSYPYPEGHPGWQAPTEPPPPPPPPPPRFVPFASSSTAEGQMPPSPPGGARPPSYAVAGGPQPAPGAELPVPGGPPTSNLPERLAYPSYQEAGTSRPNWMRRFAMGVAGLLVLFLIGLGIGHLFGGSSSTPTGSQSSRFTQLPSQAPVQPQATAPAQTQPTPVAPPTPVPSAAPTVTGSATWHTVNAQILNGGKCSISQGCEAGGTFRNTGGLGNGVVTFNITDRSYQTVYASCTVPLPQTDTGGTATVSCWANSDQLDQLFNSNPNAYIYLQVQLGTS